MHASLQGAPTDKGPYLQARAPTLYTDNGPIEVCKDTLKTRARPNGGPLQTKRHYRKWVFTYREPLQTRGHHRKGAIIDKEFIQTKGLYSKRPQ